MKKLFALVVLAAMSVDAATLVPSRQVSTPVLSEFPVTNRLDAVLQYQSDNWHTLSNYWTRTAGIAYVGSYVATNTIPGTNFEGAVYNPTTRVWSVTAIQSNVTTIQQTLNTVSNLFTIISNGAPVITDYMDLTNSLTTFQSYGSDPWSGNQTVPVTTWAAATAAGSELGFAAGTGVVTIPSNCVALSFVDGILKDSTTNAASYVRLRYIDGTTTVNQGDMFEANREDGDDPADKVSASAVKCFPSQTSPRTLRVAAYYVHDGTTTNTYTKSKPTRWQVLLLRSI